MKQKYLISILIIVLLIPCTYFLCIYNTYGNIYEYFDINYHPQKYSYNYFLSKSIWQMEEIDTLNGQMTLTAELQKIDKIHRQKNNEKSKVLIKYIDEYYDAQRAILSDDYKNINTLKMKEQDFSLLGKESIFIPNIVNMFYPQIESKKVLQEELIKRKKIKNLIEKKFDTKIEKILFADLTYDDPFFTDFFDENKQISDITNKQLAEQIEKINKETNKEDLLNGKTALKIGKLIFDFGNKEFGNQYIGYDRNGNIFKV